MTQAPEYNRQFDFEGYSSAHPESPHPGVEFEKEYDAIKATSDAVRVNLGLLQRDDGLIRNETVHKDALASGLRALASGAWEPKGEWETGVEYEARDMVESGVGLVYVCVEGHTSGVFNDDYAAGLWMHSLSPSSEQYSGLAAEWAENAEGDAVTGHPGEYSALHHSAKALARRNAAAASAAAAALSESSASVSANNAGASESAAGASESAASGSAAAAAASEVSAGVSESAAGVSETNAGVSESSANQWKNYASEWAAKTDGIVGGFDFSAKAWSIGGTDLTGGSAKEWSITGEDEEVSGGEYSAKHWAAKSTKAVIKRTAEITADSVSSEFAIGGVIPDESLVYLNNVRVEINLGFSGGSVEGVRITDGTGGVLVGFGLIDILNIGEGQDACSKLIDVKGKTLKIEFRTAGDAGAAIPTAGTLVIVAKV